MSPDQLNAYNEAIEEGFIQPADIVSLAELEISLKAQLLRAKQ